MSIVQKIDEWVMDAVEQRAWQIEGISDVSHVTLARWSYWVYTALVAMPGLYFDWGVLGAVYVLGLIVASDFIMRPAWIRHRKRPHGTRNDLRDDVAKRIFCCAVFVTVAFASQMVMHGTAHTTNISVLLLAILSGVMFTYLLACNRMPPGFAEEEKGLASSPA